MTVTRKRKWPCCLYRSKPDRFFTRIQPDFLSMAFINVTQLPASVLRKTCASSCICFNNHCCPLLSLTTMKKCQKWFDMWNHFVSRTLLNPCQTHFWKIIRISSLKHWEHLVSVLTSYSHALTTYCIFNVSYKWGKWTRSVELLEGFKYTFFIRASHWVSECPCIGGFV